MMSSRIVCMNREAWWSTVMMFKWEGWIVKGVEMPSRLRRWEKKITSLSVTQHLGHIYTQICVTNFIENLKLESKGQSNYPDHHQLELFIS